MEKHLLSNEQDPEEIKRKIEIYKKTLTELQIGQSKKDNARLLKMETLIETMHQEQNTKINESNLEIKRLSKEVSSLNLKINELTKKISLMTENQQVQIDQPINNSHDSETLSFKQLQSLLAKTRVKGDHSIAEEDNQHHSVQQKYHLDNTSPTKSSQTQRANIQTQAENGKNMSSLNEPAHYQSFSIKSKTMGLSISPNSSSKMETTLSPIHEQTQERKVSSDSEIIVEKDKFDSKTTDTIPDEKKTPQEEIEVHNINKIEKQPDLFSMFNIFKKK